MDKPHRVRIRLDGSNREGVYLDGRRLQSTEVSFSNRASDAFSLVTITVVADVDVIAYVEPENLTIRDAFALPPAVPHVAVGRGAELKAASEKMSEAVARLRETTQRLLTEGITVNAPEKP